MTGWNLDGGDMGAVRHDDLIGWLDDAIIRGDQTPRRQGCPRRRRGRVGEGRPLERLLYGSQNVGLLRVDVLRESPVEPFLIDKNPTILVWRENEARAGSEIRTQALQAFPLSGDEGGDVDQTHNI